MPANPPTRDEIANVIYDNSLLERRDCIKVASAILAAFPALSARPEPGDAERWHYVRDHAWFGTNEDGEVGIWVGGGELHEEEWLTDAECERFANDSANATEMPSLAERFIADRTSSAAALSPQAGDAEREALGKCGCVSHEHWRDCDSGCLCACNADFVRVERWKCRIGCGLLITKDEITAHDCQRAMSAPSPEGDQ